MGNNIAFWLNQLPLFIPSLIILSACIFFWIKTKTTLALLLLISKILSVIVEVTRTIILANALGDPRGTLGVTGYLSITGIISNINYFMFSILFLLLLIRLANQVKPAYSLLDDSKAKDI